MIIARLYFYKLGNVHTHLFFMGRNNAHRQKHGHSFLYSYRDAKTHKPMHVLFMCLHYHGTLYYHHQVAQQICRRL